MKEGMHPVSSCLPCDLDSFKAQINHLWIVYLCISRVYRVLETQIMESCENGEWTVLLLWSLSRTPEH